MSGPTRDETAEAVFSRESNSQPRTGTGKKSFHCSADLEQIDSHNSRFIHTLLKVLNIHIYIHTCINHISESFCTRKPLRGFEGGSMCQEIFEWMHWLDNFDSLRRILLVSGLLDGDSTRCFSRESPPSALSAPLRNDAPNKADSGDDTRIRDPARTTTMG